MQSPDLFSQCLERIRRLLLSTCLTMKYIPRTVKIHYHSPYSILDFDWLIHLQITACKYRSAANNWCKYFIEHAQFENASSASIKNISFFQNVNMARFVEFQNVNCPLY